jgi:hypothetical protein
MTPKLCSQTSGLLFDDVNELQLLLALHLVTCLGVHLILVTCFEAYLLMMSLIHDSKVMFTNIWFAIW